MNEFEIEIMRLREIEIRRLRARLLALEGDELTEAHGLIVGVMCALERKRGRNYAETDRLIAELRDSEGPEDFSR